MHRRKAKIEGKSAVNLCFLGINIEKIIDENKGYQKKNEKECKEYIEIYET